MKRKSAWIWILLGIVFTSTFSKKASGLELELSTGPASIQERALFIQAIQSIRNRAVKSPSLEIDGAHPPLAGITNLAQLFAASQSADSAWNHAYQRAHFNGDMYILWGNLSDQWTQLEYDQFYSVSKWLVKHSFRNIINPFASEADVRAAVSDPHTAGIIWSSRSSRDGRIYDSSDHALARDVFFTHASPSFHHLVLSNSYGDATVKHYRFPATLNVHHWTGTTTTNDLFTYLFSDQWNRDVEKDLGIKLQ